MVRSGKSRSTNGRGRELGIATVWINAVFAGVGGLYASTRSITVTVVAIAAVVILVVIALAMSGQGGQARRVVVRTLGRNASPTVHSRASHGVSNIEGPTAPRRPVEGPLEAEAQQNGIPDWFEDFYRSHYRDLVRAAGAALVRWGLDRCEAEDVVHEVFARQIKRGKWDHIEAPLPYFVRAVVNRTESEARLALRRAKPSDTIADASNGTLSDLEQWMDDQWVADLLATLTPARRKVMNLVLEGLSGPEIAASLGANEKTVRSTIRHARKRLQDLVAPQTHSARAVEQPNDVEEEQP
ncbi:hypothetical protein GCM10009661_57060 [Catellatospora chokoriensis]|uniref:HTH luxR-type domain-containing protein n=2 Tax=Catellatospora chokoriensis TaxID=310353 RepID=A0A8J3K0H4_9ACTN|nr:hypothetical protein Cch02nite_38870 [Catellatospora chokoriensis]